MIPSGNQRLWFVLTKPQASGETLNRIGIGASVNDALGHGLGAAVATFICVHVSGALFNPAMSMAFWLTRRIDGLTALCFTAAQIIGSIASAGILRASLQSLTSGLGVPRLTGLLLWHGVLIEAVLGAFLVWFTAMGFIRGRYYWYRNRYRHHGTSPLSGPMAALMSFVWNGAVEAAFVGTVGSGPNPGRFLGPAIVSGRLSNWPVWIAGPYIGALIGVGLYWLDVALLRPDRTNIDASHRAEADARQARRQGSVMAPNPPVPGIGALVPSPVTPLGTAQTRRRQRR